MKNQITQTTLIAELKGYIPEGKGVTYNYDHTIPGNSYPLDDDLVLWFTKKLS